MTSAGADALISPLNEEESAAFHAEDLDALLKDVENIDVMDGDDQDLFGLEEALLGNASTNESTDKLTSSTEARPSPSGAWDANKMLANDTIDPNEPNMDDLLEQINTLEEQNTSLQQANAAFEKENQELKAQLKRLQTQGIHHDDDDDSGPKMQTLAEVQQLKQNKVISAKTELSTPAPKIQELEAVVENLQARIMLLVEEKLQLQTKLDTMEYEATHPKKKKGGLWFQKTNTKAKTEPPAQVAEEKEDAESTDPEATKTPEKSPTKDNDSPKKSTGSGWLFLSSGGGSKKKKDEASGDDANDEHDETTAVVEEDGEFTSTPVQKTKPEEKTKDPSTKNPWSRMVSFVNQHTNTQAAKIDQLLVEGQEAVGAPDAVETYQLNSILTMSSSSNSLTEAETREQGKPKPAQGAQVMVDLLVPKLEDEVGEFTIGSAKDPHEQAAAERDANIETVEFRGNSPVASSKTKIIRKVEDSDAKPENLFAPLTEDKPTS